MDTSLWNRITPSNGRYSFAGSKARRFVAPLDGKVRGKEWASILARVRRHPRVMILATVAGLAMGLTGVPYLRSNSATGVDPLSILAGRSPGARSSVLLQTKPGKAVQHGHDVPPRPGAPGLGTELPSEPELAGFGPFVPPLFDLLLPSVPYSGDTFALGGGSGGGAFFPGIAGGYGGGGFVGSGPFVPGNMVAPVPEPSSWLTLIAGLTFAGATLRTTRRGVRRQTI